MIDAQGRWLPDITPRGFEAFNDYHRFLLLTGPRKCVARETYVSTDNGLEKIGSFAELDGPETTRIAKRVYSFDGKKLFISNSDVFHRNPCKEALRLRFNNGKELVVSHQHPMWVSYADKDGDPYFGYVAASEMRRMLDLGIKVFMPFVRTVPHAGSVVTVQIPTLDYWRKTIKPAEIETEPITIDESMAYMLGAMCGDGGCQTRNASGACSGLTFTNADEECVGLVRKALKAIGSQLNRCKDEKTYYYRVCGHEIRRLIEAIGMDSLSNFKRIPELIMANSLLLKEFLSGLFDTDGCAARNGSVGIVSTSEYLIRDVQDALTVFGIFSCICERTNYCLGVPCHCWQLVIYGDEARAFFDRIGFKIPRKQARRRSIPNPKTIFYGYPDHIRPYLKKLRYRHPALLKHTREWHRQIRWTQSIGSYVPTRQKLERWIEIAGSTPVLEQFMVSDRWVCLEGVTECEADLVDITVQSGSSFITAGYINHNSSKTVSGACPKLCRHLWENDGAVVAIVGKTLRNIKSSGVWQDLTEFTIPRWIGADIGFKYTVEPKMTGDTKMTFFKVRNMHGGESECQVHSLEHEHEVETKFKSTRFSMFYLPETDQFKNRHVFDILEDQLRIMHIPYEQHQILMDCNPPEEAEDHWLYPLFFGKSQEQKDTTTEDGETQEQADYRAWNKENFHVIPFTLDDNTFMSAKEKSALKAKYAYDQVKYKRFVQGLWVRDTTNGHFSDVFIPNIHIRGNTDAPRQEDWEVIVPGENTMDLVTGWDIGDVNHSWHLIAPRDSGDLNVFDVVDELVVIDRQVSIADFTFEVMEKMDRWTEILKDLYGDQPVRWRHWADDSAWKYKSAADAYDALIVKQASKGKIGLHAVSKIPGSVKTRISLLKKLLFDDRIFVSAQCKATINMIRYLKRPGGKASLEASGPAIDPESPYKHPFDSLTYALLNEAPMDVERRSTPTTRSGRIISVAT